MAPIDIGLLILRLAVGGILFVHGAQKAWGWWQGPGLERWTQAVGGMGFRPVALFTALSIGAELSGGLLVLGLLSPLAAAVVIGQAVVIVGKAHLAKGFFNTNGGYEFPLSLAAGAAAILFAGPGTSSLDNLIGFAATTDWRAGLFALGIFGGLAALAWSAASARSGTAATAGR
jgi:putative oxidoreductase